jgi:CARDB
MRRPRESTRPIRKRGFKKQTALAAALACLAAALAMLAAAPALGAGTRPDLVITKVKVEGLGRDPYLAIGPSGEAQRFIVRVTAANRGKAASGRFKIIVKATPGPSEHAQPGWKVGVGPLKPGRSATRSVIVEGYKPHLGFSTVKAEADGTHRVKESKEANNTRHGTRLPVVARNWDVTLFDTFAGVLIPLPQKHTTEDVDLYFRLAGFDERKGDFEYKAIGSVRDTASEEGTCNWHGERTADLNPWPDGELLITRSLNSYSAVVEEPEGEALSYPVQVSCLGGFTYETQIKFQNLETFVGLRRFPSMKPTDRSLQGRTEDRETNTIFNWWFKADVP